MFCPPGVQVYDGVPDNPAMLTDAVPLEEPQVLGVEEIETVPVGFGITE